MPVSFRPPSRRWVFAALAALALAAPRAGAEILFGEGNGVPMGYTPKDFTILQRDGVFHALYIMTNRALRTGGGNLGEHLNERRFGHAVSTDLVSWTFVDSLFGVNPGGFDKHHVWAPTLIWADGRYWMFYTGVEDTLINGSWQRHRQQLGLAWTHDFTLWGRMPTPVFRCGPPDSPWAECAEGGLRDPFVIRADTSAAGAGWFMYFATKPSSAPPGYYHPWGYLVGAASGHDGDMTYWQDFGPNWSTYRTYQGLPSELTDKVESPHVFHHAGQWHLFFTGDLGIAHLTGASPVGDIPVHQNEWTYQGVFPETPNTEFASETFRATWVDGSVEDYFATVRSVGWYSNIIVLRVLNPATGGPLLADPLRFAEIMPLLGGIAEGESLSVYFRSYPPFAPGTAGQTMTRPAPIEIWEADDAAGARTWTKLDPAAVGFPGAVRVTTCFEAGDHGDVLTFAPRWIADDDDTPDRLELQIRSRNQVSAVFTVVREGHPVTGVGEAPVPAVTLSAAVRPDGPGAEFRIALDRPERARLDLFDVRGRRVHSLLDRDLPAGETRLSWDGRDRSGVAVPAGVVFARLAAGGRTATARVGVLH